MLIFGTDPKRPALPHSDATNGYDLVTDVIQCILDEPKRFYMPDWVLLDDELALLPGPPSACNTAACFGGWIVLLKLGAKEHDYHSFSELALDLALGEAFDYDYPMSWSRQEARTQLSILFGCTTPKWVEDEGVDEDGFGLGHYPVPGTMEYAEQYAARFREFRDKYEDVLRARTLAA